MSPVTSLKTCSATKMGVFKADPDKTLARVDTTNELTAAVTGEIPHRPLWRMLAIVLLMTLLVEIALTRWIAIQRKALTVSPVTFGADTVDAKAFRKHAKDLLAVGTPQEAGADEP